MRIHKLVGFLLLISAACVVFLALTTTHFHYRSTSPGAVMFPATPGYENSWGSRVGQVLGAGFAVFVLAAIGAMIGRLGTRRTPGRNPDAAPVAGAVLMAVGVTALVWAGAFY
jgi:hypothetical protein